MLLKFTIMQLYEHELNMTPCVSVCCCDKAYTSE